MADSEISTSLSAVTRRRLLAGTTAATVTWPFQNGAAAANASVTTTTDPALALWHEWRAAYHRTLAACRKQQRLEARLINRVGFPCAEVFLPDEDVTITMHGPEQVEELFGDDPSWAATRAKAHADLAAYQVRWDSVDRELGYSAAKQAEEDAADHEQDLFDTLTHTPAATLAGVAGKLDAVLREGESWEDCSDFPWPQIRSALVDLARLGQAMRPGTFIPGSDRNAPYLRRHRDGCCFQVCRGLDVSGS
ncbi:hypothetical protein [Chelativorans alearense]|uniref:hypothetical protein n=1 Tax=Chelativorans alearense TaxID=2681495 RepID=UPI0013D12A96|nr:hypothetical protein [Chelativorans alearense]